MNNENLLTPIIPSSEEVLFIEKNAEENHFLEKYFSIDLVDLFHHEFHFVTFQIFCRTDDEDGGDYFPAEMSIIKYSFSRSTIDEYFTLIKPERFPVGYTGTAIDVARETHQIPPFDFIGANGNYIEIWQNVQRILGGLFFIFKENKNRSFFFVISR